MENRDNREGGQIQLPPQLQSYFTSILDSLTKETPEQQLFTSKFTNYHNQVLNYENPLTIAKALSMLPINDIHSKAELRNQTENGGVNEIKLKQECFIRELMHWFKHEFFSWVDAPPCSSCSNKETKAVGMENNQTGERVEAYKCSLCGQFTRFPRYNNPETLLSTRKGRCGEWANAFTLFCRATGYEARLILDFTDHVWTEVFIGSENDGDWVHCDACEEKFNSPLLYERGWGKQLNYLFAFSADEIKDVTLRYTSKWEEILTRRKDIREDLLQLSILSFNNRVQSNLSNERKQILKNMSKKEDEFFQLKLQHKNIANFNQDELEGRVSGSKEWRSARGEIGNNNNNNNNNNNDNNINNNEEEEMKEAMVTSLNFNHVVFAFNSFNQLVKSLSFNHNAKIVNNYLQLTEKANDRKGSVWFLRPLPLNTHFQVNFQFQIKNPGADGFAFVIQKNGINEIGGGGSDMGYAGISNSIAIEFDTYECYDRSEDPNNNHISIQSRGNLPNSSHHKYSLYCNDRLNVKLSDQRVHSVKISYYFNSNEPNQSILEMKLDNSIVFVIYVNLIATLNGSSNNNYDNERAWFGFTAATGGLSQEHNILSWSHLLTK